jgi:hypothetical protein
MRTISYTIYPAFALFAFACFALVPQARATCQDACLTNSNTAQGEDALISLTIGIENTAIGFNALLSDTSGNDNTASGNLALSNNTTGSANTAIGNWALLHNTTGTANTATGHAALVTNTTGGSNTATGEGALAGNINGSFNTATGDAALGSNTIGNENTAHGFAALSRNTQGANNTADGSAALQFNTFGMQNTATGSDALFSNTTGNSNTAAGCNALEFNTTGINNTASGFNALSGNTTGNYNTADGQGALFTNTTGRNNTADGQNALSRNTTGSNNIALGSNAGGLLTTGNNNIDIFHVGVAGESNTIRIGKQGTQTATFIAGVSGATVPSGVAVIVDSSGHLGTTTSSARFKEAIKPMDRDSEALLALKPVTFHYTKKLDPDGISQFGLVAEEVQKVNPDLVARDEEGKPYTVRYDAVNAMLLNEFFKEHRKVQELEANAVQQQNAIKALTAMIKEQASQIQKVSAEVELSRTVPQTVLVNR